MSQFVLSLTHRLAEFLLLSRSAMCRDVSLERFPGLGSFMGIIFHPKHVHGRLGLVAYSDFATLRLHFPPVGFPCAGPVDTAVGQSSSIMYQSGRYPSPFFGQGIPVFGQEIPDDDVGLRPGDANP